MKKYVSLQIKELINNVAVDIVHVKELSDSIMKKGQLAPVIVREETNEVIDGFHRVEAMKELGFDHVDCVTTPCDDEEFWDFRIVQAALHKSVTFARAVDWVDQVFKLSPWTEKYKSGFSLFQQAERGKAPKEIEDWAMTKAKTWGLAIGTIKQWMYTKQVLEPSLLQEAKDNDIIIPTNTYVEVATKLPTKPELHKLLVEKATKETLSTMQIRAVAQALNRAGDKDEIKSILEQSVTRTEKEIVREARADKILGKPREVTQLERFQKAETDVVLHKIELLRMINTNSTITLEKINILTSAQKVDICDTCETLITGTQEVIDMIMSTMNIVYQIKGDE